MNDDDCMASMTTIHNKKDKNMQCLEKNLT